MDGAEAEYEHNDNNQHNMENESHYPFKNCLKELFQSNTQPFHHSYFPFHKFCNRASGIAMHIKSTIMLGVAKRDANKPLML